MNTTMADGAEQRLDAQIAEALFGQPGMSKMDVANRVRELRGDGPALLANEQPGGTVRLGDADPMRSALEDALQFVEILHSTVSGDSRKIVRRCLERGRAALSAQPSPGGQGWPFVESPADFAERMVQALRKFDMLGAVRHVLIENPPALAARQPDAAIGGDAHDIEDPCDVITRAAQKLSAAGQPRIADRLVRARTEVERLQAAYLAARQPAGQEPNGYFDPDVLAHLTEGLIDPVGVLRRKPNGKSNVPVWLAPPAQAVDDRFPNGLPDAIEYADEMEEAASAIYEKVFGHEDDGEDCGTVVLRRVLHHLNQQPAQAVDLEEFREAVDHWRRDLASDYAHGYISDGGAAMAKADRLLALIDSQAVGE